MNTLLFFGVEGWNSLRSDQCCYIRNSKLRSFMLPRKSLIYLFCFLLSHLFISIFAKFSFIHDDKFTFKYLNSFDSILNFFFSKIIYTSVKVIEKHRSWLIEQLGIGWGMKKIRIDSNLCCVERRSVFFCRYFAISTRHGLAFLPFCELLVHVNQLRETSYAVLSGMRRIFFLFKII